MPVNLSASVDETAMVRLVAAWPDGSATPQDVTDFLDASDETPPDGGMSERATIVNNMRLRGIAQTASSWDEFVAVVGAIVAVAGVVSAISSAITGVYAVGAL